jgi:hypothetical protein
MAGCLGANYAARQCQVSPRGGEGGVTCRNILDSVSDQILFVFFCHTVGTTTSKWLTVTGNNRVGLLCNLQVLSEIQWTLQYTDF